MTIVGAIFMVIPVMHVQVKTFAPMTIVQSARYMLTPLVYIAALLMPSLSIV